VVKLCKNWTPPKQRPVAARFVRETPTKNRAATPNPSQPLQRARYFDPSTGEFLSKDPLEYVDGMSMYRGYFVPAETDSEGFSPADKEAECIKHCRRQHCLFGFCGFFGGNTQYWNCYKGVGTTIHTMDVYYRFVVGGLARVLARIV